MNCERYQKRITDAAIGALPPREEQELGAHVAVCANCRAALAREQELQATIARGLEFAVVELPSPGFTAGVMRRVDATQPAAGGWVWNRRWITLAAAVAVMVLAIVWWFKPPATKLPTTAGNSAPAQQVGLAQRTPETVPAESSVHPVIATSRPAARTTVASNPNRPKADSEDSLSQSEKAFLAGVLVPANQWDGVMQLYAGTLRARAALRAGNAEELAFAKSGPDGLEWNRLEVRELAVPELKDPPAPEKKTEL